MVYIHMVTLSNIHKYMWSVDLSKCVFHRSSFRCRLTSERNKLGLCQLEVPPCRRECSALQACLLCALVRIALLSVEACSNTRACSGRIQLAGPIRNTCMCVQSMSWTLQHTIYKHISLGGIYFVLIIKNIANISMIKTHKTIVPFTYSVAPYLVKKCNFRNDRELRRGFYYVNMGTGLSLNPHCLRTLQKIQ